MGPFYVNGTEQSNSEVHNTKPVHHHKDCCGCHCFEKCKNDCLCLLLEDFLGDDVTITTKTHDMITGKLKSVMGCCVKILAPGSMSSLPIPSRVIFIRCEDIESFYVNLPGY